MASKNFSESPITVRNYLHKDPVVMLYKYIIYLAGQY